MMTSHSEAAAQQLTLSLETTVTEVVTTTIKESKTIKTMDELRELMGDREYVTMTEVLAWTDKTWSEIERSCGGANYDFAELAKMYHERPIIKFGGAEYVCSALVIGILMRCCPAFMDDAWKALANSPAREQLEAKAADIFGEEIAAQLAEFKP